MKPSIKGAAKRLTFSLFVVSALGGCAVYGPVAPGPYTYTTDAYGQPVYATPPVSAYPYYSPYYYDPVYIAPPVSLNFGFGFPLWGGHHSFDRGGRGGPRGSGRGHR
ncbi:conserved hypothetical protein [Rhodoferax ferrireducens T118]|uniref:Lipoprotein n=1 Tax=Albidiferax ferrireducens (strain ATCC BAA-621 / DSM 15236 / T118) TaxID=338969 RepID=Q222J7_ALBFT|nr:conserved hypothetical protein [Rhodoferax ferrireducens T118]